MERRFFYGFKLTAPLSNRSNGFWHRILTHTVRCGFDGIPTVRFGAAFRYCESYGAVRCCDISNGVVRCGFKISQMLLCGSVRFLDVENPTVRFGTAAVRVEVVEQRVLISITCYKQQYQSSASCLYPVLFTDARASFSPMHEHRWTFLVECCRKSTSAYDKRPLARCTTIAALYHHKAAGSCYYCRCRGNHHVYTSTWLRSCIDLLIYVPGVYIS